MRRYRIIIGTFISVLFMGMVLPVGYWFLSRYLDRLLGISTTALSFPVGFILAGLCWSIALFWILWAYSYLIWVGSGSPVEAFGVALEPTLNLVTGGPYAYARNPMVFGFLFVLLGVGFLANSVVGIGLVPIVGLLAAGYLRLFEEKELVRRFGTTYEHYRDNVPMIVPRPDAYVLPVAGHH